MSIKENLLSRYELASEMGVCAATVDRWIRIGVAGVKLIPVYIGYRPHFTREAVQQFQDGIAKRKIGYTAPPPKRKVSPAVLENLRRDGYIVDAK